MSIDQPMDRHIENYADLANGRDDSVIRHTNCQQYGQNGATLVDVYLPSESEGLHNPMTDGSIDNHMVSVNSQCQADDDGTDSAPPDVASKCSDRSQNDLFWESVNRSSELNADNVTGSGVQGSVIAYQDSSEDSSSATSSDQRSKELQEHISPLNNRCPYTRGHDHFPVSGRTVEEVKELPPFLIAFSPSGLSPDGYSLCRSTTDATYTHLCPIMTSKCSNHCGSYHSLRNWNGSETALSLQVQEEIPLEVGYVILF